MRITTTLTFLAAAALSWTTAFAQITPKTQRQHEFKVEAMVPIRPLYKADTLRIIALGDIMMHTLQIQTAKSTDGSYDFSSYFKHLEQKISQADLAIANMEFTLGGEPYTGYPSFSAPDSFCDYLGKIGFDIFLCANNHIFDKGASGAERTIQKYEELREKYGILYTGLQGEATENDSNNPLLVTRKGIRLAILNFTYGTNVGSGKAYPKVNRLTDKDLLKKSLNNASNADFTLVFPHWGVEYVLRHSLQQRKDAEFMVNEGADMVVGSHPHVVQDYELIDGVPVVYSLGNAVSNMSAPNTQVELMAEIEIIRNENGDLSISEPILTWLWCSRPGGYGDEYTVIPIEEFVGRKDEWVGKWDYEKMVSSWMRVMDATGIGGDY